MVDYVKVGPQPITVPPWLKQGSDDKAVAADPSLTVKGFSSEETDVLAGIVLETIGAVELSMITRYDSLDGVKMAYSAVPTVSRMAKYSASNLMGYPSSMLSANGQGSANAAHYIQGEISNGYELSEMPTGLELDIQVATSGDVVPFSATGNAYEVI